MVSRGALWTAAAQPPLSNARTDHQSRRSRETFIIPTFMAITTGSRLGPYEMISLIGAGGMGEVYKARDTRLDRSVAIKVLPPAFADNAQLKLRFEREAKTISQLTHPHICTLYDVGNDHGVEVHRVHEQ